MVFVRFSMKYHKGERVQNQGPRAEHRHLSHSRPAKAAEASSRRRMDEDSQEQTRSVRKPGSRAMFWKRCTGQSYFGKNWPCMPGNFAG